MLIDVLIIHYKETQEQVDRLLSSINSQGCLDKIKVTILNAGDENTLSDLDKYDFDIDYDISKSTATTIVRNELLRRTSGEYIWFLDSDDFLFEDCLKDIVDILENNKPDALSIGAYMERNGKTFLSTFERATIVGCNILQRKLIEENNLYCYEGVRLAGDLVIEELPKFYAQNKYALNKVVLYYSCNPQSVTNNMDNNGWREERVKTFDYIINKLLQDKIYIGAYVEYLYMVLQLSNKYIHDKYKDIFIKLGLYDIKFNLDLR